MKVFLVEDSLMIRALLARTIEAMPVARVVGEAECEEMAIAMIEHSRPDLVLLDLQLAFGGSGLNVLQRLRRAGFAAPIFVMSNQVIEAYRQAAFGLGADRFYDKTLDMPRLIDDLGAMQRATPAVAPAPREPRRPQELAGLR
ncbi:MAG: response regulator [Burkholderiaceae bacterium]